MDIHSHGTRKRQVACPTLGRLYPRRKPSVLILQEAERTRRSEEKFPLLQHLGSNSSRPARNQASCGLSCLGHHTHTHAHAHTHARAHAHTNIQIGREISAIIETDDYLRYKKTKQLTNYLSLKLRTNGNIERRELFPCTLRTSTFSSRSHKDPFGFFTTLPRRSDQKMSMKWYLFLPELIEHVKYF